MRSLRVCLRARCPPKSQHCVTVRSGVLSQSMRCTNPHSNIPSQTGGPKGAPGKRRMKIDQSLYTALRCVYLIPSTNTKRAQPHSISVRTIARIKTFLHQVMGVAETIWHASAAHRGSPPASRGGTPFFCRTPSC